MTYIIDALAGSPCVWTGVGKSGHAASLLAATGATLGLQSRFIEPLDLLHGELSGLRLSDIIVGVSWSGRTVEVNQVLDRARARGNLTFIMTAALESTHMRVQLPRTEDFLLKGVPCESVITTLNVGYELFSQLAAIMDVKAQLLAGHPAGAIGEALR